MPKILLENVTKRYDKFYAVEDLNLEIEDNAFVLTSISLQKKMEEGNSNSNGGLIFDGLFCGMKNKV